MMKNLFAWLRRDASQPFLAKIRALDLRPGDVAIDGGANVGVVTAAMAENGATVYAFEPNPDAFARLQARFAGQPNVHCLCQGVLDEPGQARLFLHQNAGEDPVLWSTGSSLRDDKGNVAKDRFVDIEVIDLCAFVRGLGRKVRLLKLDVEGVECRILRKLIETGLIQEIEHVWVETHDQKIPALRAETDALRARIRELGLEHVRLDWI